MAAAFDFKILLTLLCLFGVGLAAACTFGDKGSTSDSSIRMMGG